MSIRPKHPTAREATITIEDMRRLIRDELKSAGKLRSQAPDVDPAIYWSDVEEPEVPF